MDQLHYALTDGVARITQAARSDGPADDAACKALEDLCYASADYKEGRRAFMEKRQPRFQGA